MSSTVLRASIGLLAIVGCARGPDAPTPSVPTPAASAASEPSDDGRVAISGRVLAHDGTPLRRAAVTVRRNGFREPVASATLDERGRFEVEVEPGGVYGISIAAVDHAQIFRRTVVSAELRVEGRLGTYGRAEAGESLTIRADYLGSEGSVLGSGPGSASRVADDRYRLDLAAKPEGAVEMRYQLVHPSGRSHNGPVADRYEDDGGGDYWSVVDVTSRDTVELELGALPPPGLDPRLEWTGESPTTTAVTEFQDRWFRRMNELRQRMPRKDGKITQMTDDLLAEARALAEEARAEIEAAPDPTSRAVLHGAFLGIFSMFIYGSDQQTELREQVEHLVDHLSPADPHLALLFNVDNNLFRARQGADEAFLAKTDAWLERRAREHGDPSTAISALTTLLFEADAQGDDDRVRELYAIVTDERFAGTQEQVFLAQQFDPDRILKPGKPFPAFDFAGLGDDEPHVTQADREGHLYLLEFWATWCGPCVAEMPKLHTTYAAINGAKRGKGRQEAGLRRLRAVKRPTVEFVFVSLDGAPSDVQDFREQHWSMPWTHGFVGKEGEAETMARFGFSGVPTAVLVDETGTILEVGGALRGEQLQPTLERVLAERAR